MNNFFGNALDFNYFKKAMKITDGESIIINLSSTDSSLVSKPKYEDSSDKNKSRKNMSNKFEPSPFGRFFGPQKRNTAPVDMNDFTSWKNKNYRRKEEQFDMDFDDDFSNFSLSKYMKDNSGDKFNDLDQAKTELQKPIEQLSSDDPTLKKFSLDSYMHKLEESILAKDKFAANEDLLEPIISSNNDASSDYNYNYNQNVFGGVVRNINKFQDEDFSASDSHIEQFAFDDETSGNDFSLDQSEIDKLKTRLDKIDKQAKKNAKDKPTQRLLLDEGLFSEDEENDILNKTKVDDFESLILKDAESIEVGEVSEVHEVKTTARGKKLNEVVVNTDTKAPGITKMPLLFAADEDELAIEQPVKSSKPAKVEEPEAKEFVEEIVEPVEEYPTEPEEDDSLDTLKKSDLLTKDSFKEITDEFMTKFTEIYKPNNVNDPQQYNPNPYYQQPMYPDQNQGFGPIGPYKPYEQPAYQPPVPEQPPVQPYADFNRAELEEYKNNQQRLQEKLFELVEQKNKTDKETEAKLKSIEEEKNKISEEYQNKLKEMEENYNKKYEEFKQKIILDTNSHKQRLKEAEDKIKAAKLEAQNELKNKDANNVGLVLVKELKSYFTISNLEMDKKLIEVTERLESGNGMKPIDSGMGYISKSDITKKIPIKINREEIEDNLNKIQEEPSDLLEPLEEEEPAELLEPLEDIVQEEPEPFVEESEPEEIEEVVEETKPKTTRTTRTNSTNSTTSKSTTSRTTPRRRKRTRTRKLDRDITGDIDF